MASGEISIRYGEFHYLVRKEHNTPGIIKYPFWQMTAENPQAVYACVNDGEAVLKRIVSKPPSGICLQIKMH